MKLKYTIYRYSILVMMADKMFLLNSWTFFIKHIEELIKLLQDSAAKVSFSAFYLVFFAC